ncbi:hypothetical protein DFH07DRAFT_967726 [Mycena maculata]|uniref:BTB domain-containing protein n=1 Tax=Mycena maculata TaxID=230809 RepID=A0AAD7I4Y8_9AGAR|nr:hypothetical protein DFH07DRAFT_967726 [Mycena maculata]
MSSLEPLATDSRRRQREDDGDDTSSPPARRQRLEDDTLVQDDTGAVVRDPVFYKDDGDCIIRVEDTLFRIHRHLLDYEDSAFRGLFSLPCGTEGTVEGQADTNPITLSGDTVEEIRAFFHYAYSSPLDLQYDDIPPDNTHRLINAVRFTHKYHLASFEKWAVNAISNICARQKSAILRKWPAEMYVSLLALHLLSPMPTVKTLIRTTWISRLRHKEPSVKLLYALNAVDALQYRELLGEVYYRQLLELTQPAQDVEATQAAPVLAPELTDVQKLRLLMGYRSLSLSWTRITATVPVLGGACSSRTHQLYCVAPWEDEWKRVVGVVVNASGRMDIIQRLHILRSVLAESECRHCPAVVDFIDNDLKVLTKKLLASLADHFLGPEAAPPAAQ